ncbi:MAG TPA: IPT/TIG domain-containing protein [Candidatus Acidoferrales bacterium]|nr:IPT/TIG domain-containing protein [Candidatus Acidoferrales bacterium]
MRLPNQGIGAAVPDEAYDFATKQVFVSDPDVNAVEVYSTVDGHHVAEIGVPGPAGLGFSPDYKELVVGTITPYIYLIDPSALHVTSEIAIPPSQLGTDARGDTTLPVMPYAMADGSIFIGMGVTPESSSLASVAVTHLLRYVPASGTFTPEDPNASGLLSAPARSGDGKYLICASGQLFLYSVSAQAYVATSTALPAQSTSTFVAANPDGSQFASISNSEVMLWSANLTQQGSSYTIPATILSAPIYSRDGNDLYAIDQTLLYAINTQTGQPAGYLGISVGSLFPTLTLFDADENNHLFGGISPGGAVVVNASQLDTVAPPLNIPDFTGPSTEANPNVGPVGAGTQVQFIPAPAASGGNADGIADSMEAYFGSVPATQDVVAPYPASSNGGNFLTATAPATTTSGPVSVLLTDANNNPVFLPDAYTYGPRLLRVEPNVVSSQGGDQITLVAYGLGFFDLNSISVTIGGAPAGKVNLNSYASADYPEQSISVTVPAGTPGWADIVVTTPNGTDTMKRGVEYLQKEANLNGGPFGFAVYDSVRDRFYLTGNGNSVAVFDPGTQSMLAPLQSAAVSASATLESEALTPDSNTLLVADPADKLVVIFNLAAGTSTTVNVMLPSDPPTTLSAPMSLVAAANHRAFVSLSPCIPDPVREINLSNLSVQTRPDAASTCTTYVPYPELGGSSADGSTIVFASNNELQPPGPEYIWRYDDASDAFHGPVLVADSPWVAGWAAANQDGSVITLSQGTLDQQLLPRVPITQSFGEDSRLNETGSLLYASNGSSDQVTVLDTHNGRRLLLLDLPASLGPSTGPYRPLAIDPTGQQILVATQSGLSYFKLSVVPLAVGTVSPTQGPAGTTIQLKGSGFVSGTTVQIGGQAASCGVVDSETISCTVPNLTSGPTFMTLTNPDGQTYYFENVFTVQ